MERLALSIEEAAELIAVSPWTIRAWIKQGKLVATRLGRRVCITPEALKEFVRDGTSSKGHPQLGR
jgi:excisionase family DNA binding protein